MKQCLGIVIQYGGRPGTVGHADDVALEEISEAFW